MSSIPASLNPADEAASELQYISPIGYSQSSRCGYCGNRKPNSRKGYSYYARAVSISPGFYQTLIDRCWRRSGTLLYRPDQRASCCPHYTIRLDSRLFRPKRDQRQVVNRFNAHVLGQEYVKAAARLFPRSRAAAKQRDTEFDLAERVHESEVGQLEASLQPAHRFEVTLERDTFTEEKYAVYNNYQAVVHNDSPEHRTRTAFRRFLCESPLRREVVQTPRGPRQLGSHHQCYRLDGKLVAVGVLDLLPHAVSSVYFMYDESWQKFFPGKLGALQEIALAREAGYNWWYPGFYIHSCQKMRYKIDYKPQEILDPETCQWDRLDQDVLALLNQKPYVSLSRERQLGQVGHEESRETSGQLGEHGSVSPKDSGGTAEQESDEDEEEDRSLFAARVPGIPTLEEMERCDLDHIAMRISQDVPLLKTSHLVVWKSSTVRQWPGLKACVAELVAAVGPDQVNQLCIDLSR